jgi:hypothetical protein
MWGLIADKGTLSRGQPAAVMFLLLWVVIAFVILRGVDDRPRTWGPEDLPGDADNREQGVIASAPPAPGLAG